MTAPLAKYHARSPRYILQPEDDTLVRIAGPQQMPWEESTELKNISLTGLVFTAASDLSPDIGEILKIEYNVPGGEKMAGYAMVTRLEDRSASKTLVAVKFYRMALPQRLHLAQSLASKLREQQLEKIQLRRKKAGVFRRHLPLVLLILWALLFYFVNFLHWPY